MTGRRMGEPGPGREAALGARGRLESVIFALPEIPLALDRLGVRDRLLRAIQYLYAVLDTAVTATVHLDGLSESAVMVAEARALLAAAGNGKTIPTLDAAVEHLDAALDLLRQGAAAVSEIQFARRDELSLGVLDAVPPVRPFRASTGVPRLHSIARQPLLPHVIVEPKVPLPAPTRPAVTLPRPTSFAGLAALVADAASGALAARLLDAPAEPPESPPPELLPFPYVAAVGEAEVLRRVAHDCLEDIGNSRNLRKPNAMESWVDQAPFEQRILDNLDAFAAQGGAVLPLVSLYHAEAEVPDPERAFAVALTLGCIEGSDTVGAAVMTLKQSPPEEFPGYLEGFELASSGAVDVAMADLCRSPRPELAALALDVLLARGYLPDETIAALLTRTEPEIVRRVARALGTALPRERAIAHMERLCTDQGDDDTFLAALESLLRRRHPPAFDLLRGLVDAPLEGARNRRAAPLLCLVGRRHDLDRLLRAVRAAPTVQLVGALGRFGHVGALATLIEYLKHEDADVVAAAAEALARITGASLSETVEEPWEIELPPEAAEARGIPVPLREVERITRDADRWAVWVGENAHRFDPKMKTRAGLPFSPLQIVDELEATRTPPDRREDAVRELALVTGIAFAFSPRGWVARQKDELRALRQRHEAARVPSGTWPALSRQPRADTEPSARHPAPPPGEPVLVAPLPTPEGAPPETPGLVPAPAILAFSSDGGPAPGTTAPVPSLADAPPVPLVPSFALPGPTGTVALPMFDPGPVLPFSARTPAVEIVQGSRVPAPEFRTDTVALFGPAPPAALALGPFVNPSPSPWAPAPSATPEAARPIGGTRKAARKGILSLEEYAALCAEVAVFPEAAEAAFARCGLALPQKRTSTDLRWQRRLRQNPAEKDEWASLYLRYHDLFTEEARKKKPATDEEPWPTR